VQQCTIVCGCIEVHHHQWELGLQQIVHVILSMIPACKNICEKNQKIVSEFKESNPEGKNVSHDQYLIVCNPCRRAVHNV
jgi:hypothetical protein